MAKTNWNLYQDDISGGWVLEYENAAGCYPHWVRVGTYGTKAAAQKAMR